jgi:hypothetical protein
MMWRQSWERFEDAKCWAWRWMLIISLRVYDSRNRGVAQAVEHLPAF